MAARGEAERARLRAASCVLRAFAIATSVLLATACSSHREDAVDSPPDASAQTLAEKDDSARVVVDGVRSAFAADRALADRFAPNADGFRSSSEGVTSPGWRSAANERANHVGARLPATADQDIEAGVGVSDLYRLKLAHVGANASTLALDDGRGVYRDAFPSTDLAFVASKERLEWAYTLKDDKAPSEFQLRITLSKKLPTVREGVNGGFEFVDENGDALLRIPKATAIDAAGTTREASLRWDGAQLSVSLDRTGLAYPIVIDPAVETVVWQARELLMDNHRWASAAFDSARGVTVLFGGYAFGGTSSSTWEWDGVAWSLRATSGPPARANAAMTYDSGRGVTVLFGGANGNTSYNDTWEWDGTAWYKKCQTACTPPSVRQDAAMAYDPVAAKIVLFGGDYTFWNGTQYTSAGTALGDTYTWDGSQWLQTATSGPSKRERHMMTYDTTNKRVLMFGGQTDIDAAGPTYLNDLWKYSAGTWTQIATTTNDGSTLPGRGVGTFVWEGNVGKALIAGGRNATYQTTGIPDTWELSGTVWTKTSTAFSQSDQASAYDSARGKVVALRGFTYEYTSTTATWATIFDGIGARGNPASAYDAARNRVILFGGTGPTNDVWEWTGYTWTQTCTSGACAGSKPPARVGAIGGFDTLNQVFVIFGGSNALPPNNGTNYDTTYTYDGNVWTPACGSCVTGTSKPSARTAAGGAFDSYRNRFVIFGGTSGSQETWEWNGSTWARACTTTPCTNAMPSARNYAAMTYDSDRHVVMLYGGQNPASLTSEFGDTWEFNGLVWTLRQSTPPAGLGARMGAEIAYDSIRKKVVLLGGSFDGTWAQGDTWEWDNANSTWVQTVTTANGPNVRWGHVFQFDPNRRRVVAFGGATGSGGRRDTWEYYSRGGACTLDSQCATGFCVDGVCCEQVSCGTCQACNLTGTAGTCAPVVSADDPDSCPAATKTCDATGACKLKQAQSCSTNGNCASGFCANSYCCDQACTGGCDVCNATPGTCTVVTTPGYGGANPSCGAYLCDGANGACPTSCTQDAQCASGYFCAAGGVCQARRAAGLSCNTGAGGDCYGTGCAECAGTLTCRDGFCCSSACTGNCQTCAATPGTCTTVTSADDLDTCSGTSTCNSAGSCLAKAGQACTTASQCASGYCVDGVCCNSACAGGCDVCNATPGTCTIVAQGNAGASPSCGAYVCNGSTASCPATCGNDADCASGYYCGAGGTCVARKAQGATCNQAAGADCKSSGCRVCASGNCIDGYCCNTACGGSCDACNGAALGWAGATNGTCKVAPVSYAGSPACLAYACDGTSPSCATTCTSDAQCASGYYCNASGACVAQKAQGASCNLASDCKTSGTCRACVSGNCVDGYCCNSACGGQCQACDVAGAAGTCVTVTGAVHLNASLSARVACAGAGTTCGSSCNGVDASACHAAPTTTTCGSPSCASGTATLVGTCDGSGACSQPTQPCGSYTCGATACKTTCTADADCASASYYCSGGACVLKQPNGDSCSAANACASGNCVGGICCDSACTGAGFSCTLSTSRGHCAKANGTACGSSAECGSGFCVDGVCCDSACTGECQACDATGVVGTCSPVRGAPHGTRSACSGTGAGSTCGPACNGTDVLACHYPDAATKCGADSCTDGSALSTVTHVGACNGAGSCNASTGDCGTYKCVGTACASACTTTADCQTGNYCKSGFCVPIEGLGVPCTDPAACPSGYCTNGVCCGSASCGVGASCDATPTSAGHCAKLQGTACSTDGECASAHCVDGFCCDTSCTGKCEACGVSGKEGTCVPVVGQPRPGHAACSTVPGDPTCGLSCNGTDAADCHFAPTTVSCGAPSCAAGKETDVTTCDGGGNCPLVQRTCGGYQCGATTCLTSCASDADCASGNFCKAGACVGAQELGNPCNEDLQCAKGHCTDGVCCEVASCGAGAACAGLASSTPGQCLKANGVTCAASSECGSGHCVDGVCCDKGCDGQCEACDVKGSEGTCTPVTGAPHGTTRAACDALDATDCAKKACDGATRDKCGGFVNGTTQPCGADACTVDGKLQKHGACDGHGACAMPVPETCDAYLTCDAAARACKSSCAADADCQASFRCETSTGKCVPGASCSADRTQSTAKDGTVTTCAPYLCGGEGICLTSCGTSDDCVSGTSCDPTTHACIGVAPDTTSSGGCSTSGEPSTGGVAGAALAIGALSIAAARRRRGRGARAA